MEEFIVEGYLFQNAEDAALARGDVQKIELLRKRLDYTNPQEALNVYKRALDQHIFATPIGSFFLHEMKERLDAIFGGTEEVPPVPVSKVLATSVKPTTVTQKPEKTKNFDRQKYVMSILANIILVIGILAMIMISCNGKNPNILNYKQKLEDRYSSWEQDLREREDIVRQKELELRLDTREK